ncbi:MAG: hypothetical protein ACYC1C_10040 [Chloroflexota bacterium]
MGRNGIIYKLGWVFLAVGSLWVLITFGLYCLLIGDLVALAIGLLLFPLLLVWWPVVTGSFWVLLVLALGFIVVVSQGRSQPEG